MIRPRVAALLLAAAFLAPFGFGPSLAQEKTREEAVAMVKRVQKMFARDGAETTFKAIDDKATPEFHNGELYPFVYDYDGVSVAHGARPALVGKNLISLKDQDGKYLIREIVQIARKDGSGWIDYKWPNPLDNRIEDKTSYVEAMGGKYVVGVGVYRSKASSQLGKGEQ